MTQNERRAKRLEKRYLTNDSHQTARIFKTNACHLQHEKYKHPTGIMLPG